MDEPLLRWRLVLGEAAEASVKRPMPSAMSRADAALEWLYGRSPKGGQAGPRTGGSEQSQLTVPEWINEIHALFPQATIERLERDAVEVYGIAEVVTDLEVLERVEPNEALLHAVLQTRHLMNEAVLAAARRLVAEVVRRLMEELSAPVRARFHGLVARQRSHQFPKGGPLDLARTLRANLRHVDPAAKDNRLRMVDRTWFHERRHRRLDRWQIILLVDQSGSMVESVVHAAVTAAILHGLPGVDSHLIAFDTEVVDLTGSVADPVETLMGVQLGGGTFIARAVEYAAQCVRVPRRSIVVLISDFYEGDQPGRLESAVGGLVAQGTQVLGLAALDRHAAPAYDRELAARLVQVGAEVGAMTPGELALWLAEKIQR